LKAHLQELLLSQHAVADRPKAATVYGAYDLLTPLAPVFSSLVCGALPGRSCDIKEAFPHFHKRLGQAADETAEI